MRFFSTPPARFRAHRCRRALAPELFLTQLGCGCGVGVEADVQCARDVGVFDGEFPGQEQLGVVLHGGEVGRVKAAAVARNDGVGLAGVEHHHRAAAFGVAVGVGGYLYVQVFFFGEEDVG